MTLMALSAGQSSGTYGGGSGFGLGMFRVVLGVWGLGLTIDSLDAPHFSQSPAALGYGVNPFHTGAGARAGLGTQRVLSVSSCSYSECLTDAFRGGRSATRTRGIRSNLGSMARAHAPGKSRHPGGGYAHCYTSCRGPNIHPGYAPGASSIECQTRGSTGLYCYCLLANHRASECNPAATRWDCESPIAGGYYGHGAMNSLVQRGYYPVARAGSLRESHANCTSRGDFPEV